jgi:hypothetical protein
MEFKHKMILKKITIIKLLKINGSREVVYKKKDIYELVNVFVVIE